MPVMGRPPVPGRLEKTEKKTAQLWLCPGKLTLRKDVRGYRADTQRVRWVTAKYLKECQSPRGVAHKCVLRCLSYDDSEKSCPSDRRPRRIRLIGDDLIFSPTASCISSYCSFQGIVATGTHHVPPVWMVHHGTDSGDLTKRVQ